MINNLKYLFVVLLLTEIVFSSSAQSVSEKPKEYIIWKNVFKGNKNVNTDELEAIVPFSLKENTKPLNLPITPKVWYYNFGHKHFNLAKQQKKLDILNKSLNLEQKKAQKSIRKVTKLEKKVSRYKDNIFEENTWLWRNIGQKQVFLDEKKVLETSLKMKKYLFDIGFRDAEVHFKIDTLADHKKVKILYEITENQAYTIDSVAYQISDEQIKRILNTNKANQLVSKGKNFDLRLVEQEKLRIEALLKNNGYYLFFSKYIIATATNQNLSEADFKRDKKGILNLEILNPEGRDNHEQFTIDEVVFKAFDPKNTEKIHQPDTLSYNGVKFLRIANNIPLGLISNRILTKADNLYRLNDVYQTQKQIGMFNQFAFASTQINITKPEHLSISYFAPLLETYTFGISPGVNNIYNDGYSFFGFGVPITLTARNKFKRLEIIEASLRAAYEGQPSPVKNSGQAIIGSKELGFNLNVTFPTIWFFNRPMVNLSLKNPRTIFSTSFNYSEPFWGQRLNFKLKINYSIQLSKFAFLYFSPLDASLVNTTYFNNQSGNDFYNSLVELQKLGNNLKVTYDPQFVSSINSNFVYNNQNPAKIYGSSTFFRFTLESGGTFMNFSDNKDKIKFIENVFPVKSSSNSIDTVRAYFRFVKFNADYRRSINISKTSSYAYRFNMGVANPYGKNHALPYDKNFFIGGSNSVRAWAPRTLGIGSAKPDTTAVGNTIPQPGDIILESSIEYRLKATHLLGGDIQVATFVDAGNIWKWYGNSNLANDKSQFNFNRFYKEFAVGTGLGLRYDLSYFLFRFDWGIKVIDPSRAEGDRWVLDKFTLHKNQTYGLRWNFGIGFPF